jgi:FkbM family methyltransferase
MKKLIRLKLNQAVNRWIAPPEHVLEFVRIPESPSWVPESAKVDYGYWLRILTLLRDDFDISITSLLEVGANFAQDAWFLARELDMPATSVAVVEPIPQNVDIIKRNTDFTVFANAVGEQAGEVDFWVPRHDVSAWGMASLGERTIGDAEAFIAISVSARTGESLVQELGWPTIDLLKIDVEGFSGPALRSFARTLDCVKIIQIETERLPIWLDQETEASVFNLLRDSGFVLIDYQLAHDGIQADSLWMREDLLRTRAFDRVRGEWTEIRKPIADSS